MYVAYVVYGSANRVYKRRAAANGIIPVRHRAHVFDAYPVVYNFASVGKKHGRYISFALFLLLPDYHGIEAAYGVALKAGHGAATVKYKYKLGNIVLFHNRVLPKINMAAWFSTLQPYYIKL